MILASQAELSWLTALLAASPASFQPSKAAISTGEVSLPTESSSIVSHLPRRAVGHPVPGQSRQAYVLSPPGGDKAALGEQRVTLPKMDPSCRNPDTSLPAGAQRVSSQGTARRAAPRPLCSIWTGCW